MKQWSFDVRSWGPNQATPYEVPAGLPPDLASKIAYRETMDHSKIDKFKKDYPEREFPQFRSLSEGEMQMIRQRLAQRLGCSSADPLVLFKEFEKGLGLIEGMDADKKTFSLSSVISSLGTTPQEQVYLHWYREDKADEMIFLDADTNFRDIWYPGPDDLSIYDSSFDWILTITHDGAVQFLKCFSEAKRGQSD